MFNRKAGSEAIRAYRKAAMVLAGSTLLVGQGAGAEEIALATAAAAEAGKAAERRRRERDRRLAIRSDTFATRRTDAHQIPLRY